MKTKLRKLIVPLSGSICALLAAGTFAPWINAAEPIPTKRSLREPLEQAAAQNDNPRTPEESLSVGLKYLLGQQHQDGGWGQGGGWRQNLSQNGGGGRVEGPNVEDPSDLGNTCVSLVTLLRAGETPTQGAHRQAAQKAFDFICRQVEKADDKSLYVTDVRDTQLQVKIGTYVDTFLAGWALSELKDKVGEGADENRRAAALNKVVGKIERNQLADGSFANNNGWAAVLSQGLASKALNSAARSGAKVSQAALDKDQKQNVAGLNVAKGSFSPPVAAAPEPSSAGVSMYREGAKLGGLWERSKANVARKAEAEKEIADPTAPAPVKKQAAQTLKDVAVDEQAAKAASDAVASKLRDTRYTAGFGNNGGEEFLSYMNLTESIHARGGQDWEDWRAKVAKTVCGAQNEDGSWAGQHCITGRNFCTGAALLTLLVEEDKDNAKVSSANDTNAPVAKQ